MEDFKGIYKFKFIIPSIYVYSWLGMVLGPIKLPTAWAIWTIIVLSYLTCKTLFNALVMSYVAIKSRLLTDRMNKRIAHSKANTDHDFQNTKDIYFAFVIANYKEDMELLSDTISFIANHRNAKARYLVFLAM